MSGGRGEAQVAQGASDMIGLFMRVRPILAIMGAIAFLAVAVPALAHHGPGTFELGKSVTFNNATLTRLEFVNPHSWLYFETKEADGKMMKHRCEMRSAHTLRRSGWDPTMFKSGEVVTIEASPDRADPASCYLQTIRFANGDNEGRTDAFTVDLTNANLTCVTRPNSSTLKARGADLLLGEDGALEFNGLATGDQNTGPYAPGDLIGKARTSIRNSVGLGGC